MKYKIGQKVQYVGPDFNPKWRSLWAPYNSVIGPEPYDIYTIRGGRVIEGTPAYVLDEIVNAPMYWGDGKTYEMHIEEKFLRPLVMRGAKASETLETEKT